MKLLALTLATGALLATGGAHAQTSHPPKKIAATKKASDIATRKLPTPTRTPAARPTAKPQKR